MSDNGNHNLIKKYENNRIFSVREFLNAVIFVKVLHGDGFWHLRQVTFASLST